MEDKFCVVKNIETSNFLIFPTIETARQYMINEYMLHFKNRFSSKTEDMYEMVVSDFENLNKELPLIDGIMFCYPAEVYNSKI